MLGSLPAEVYEAKYSEGFLGAILTPIAGASFNYLNIVWNLGNIGNALMAGPNLVGLLFLAGMVAKVTREKLASKS